jgi:hypothetical protein
MSVFRLFKDSVEFGGVAVSNLFFRVLFPQCQFLPVEAQSNHVDQPRNSSLSHGHSLLNIATALMEDGPS